MRTGIKIQRAMFLEGLWRQMDKMASSDGGSIAKVASGYLAEGYENNEVVELLVDDGFDPTAAKACVAMAADEDGSGAPSWGFEAEDTQGDIANNFDLGMDGAFGDKEVVAWDDAQSKLDERYPGQYTVSRVFVL